MSEIELFRELLAGESLAVKARTVVSLGLFLGMVGLSCAVMYITPDHILVEFVEELDYRSGEGCCEYTYGDEL